MDVGAEAVVKLLEARHSKDVFVSECKDGPTQFGSHLRLDGWAMPRSWAHPDTTGYEIKVNRQDFLRDEKWRGYLDLCNKLYFVAPKDVIARDEVPAECGLLEVSKNAKRLLTRKKAPAREVEVPESLFRYVLMCRAQITEERTPRDRFAKWKQWLVDRAERSDVGWEIGRIISRKVSAECHEVIKKNEALEIRIRQCDIVEEVMREAGITDLHSWRLQTDAEKKLLGGVRGEVEEKLAELNSATARALKLLKDTPSNGVGGSED